MRAAFVLIVLLAASPLLAWNGRDEVGMRSVPSGANVYLDGELVGTTPLQLAVPCDQVVDRHYRIEYPGCAPAEGIVNARVAPGRVVGMVFSLGITAIFQCPRYFVPINANLTGPGCGAGLAWAPAAAPSSDLETRLKTLKDLRDRGVITEEQYQRERQNALGGL